MNMVVTFVGDDSDYYCADGDSYTDDDDTFPSDNLYL